MVNRIHEYFLLFWILIIVLIVRTGLLVHRITGSIIINIIINITSLICICRQNLLDGRKHSRFSDEWSSAVWICSFRYLAKYGSICFRPQNVIVANTGYHEIIHHVMSKLNEVLSVLGISCYISQLFHIMFVPWHGLEIARFLNDLSCDLNAQVTIKNSQKHQWFHGSWMVSWALVRHDGPFGDHIRTFATLDYQVNVYYY